MRIILTKNDPGTIGTLGPLGHAKLQEIAWPPHFESLFSNTMPFLRERDGMERCVPSKHLSPFALLSSSTVLGWPQGLSDNAPAPGQRCMDVFPNT